MAVYDILKLFIVLSLFRTKSYLIDPLSAVPIQDIEFSVLTTGTKLVVVVSSCLG